MWTPCAFLLIFSVIELRSIISGTESIQKRIVIPWTLVSGTKMVLILLLMVVSAIELVQGIVGAVNGTSSPVHYITPLIKLLTFTLVSGIMYESRKQAATSSVVLFLFWLLYGLLSIFSFYSLIKNHVRPVSLFVSHYSPHCSSFTHSF